MALSKRADRSVFRAHGFIDLNWKMYVVECGRESDHSCLRKLQSVDLDLQTVKSNSPRFPGTSLQRDRWDSSPTPTSPPSSMNGCVSLRVSTCQVPYSDATWQFGHTKELTGESARRRPASTLW